jgi:hypothetical protein
MKRTIHWQNHFFNFLAVILGVYLAFYISERSKESRDRKEMKVLTQSLITDLSEDIRAYEAYQIPVNREHEANIDGLISLLDSGSTEERSNALAGVFALENYSPSSSTYGSMKSAGKLGLIEDPDLRKQLAEYYDGYGRESEMKGTFQVDYFSEHLLPWITDHVDIMTMEILHPDEIPVLRNKLIIYSSLINQKTASYETLVEKSKALVARMEE